MTMNPAAAATTAAEDAAISRALRVLLAHHNLVRGDLVSSFPASEDTLFRRFRRGGWTAAEVVRLAAAFGVPGGDLLIGRVDPEASTWRPMPSPDGGGDGLPRLDLNQKPAGSQHVVTSLYAARELRESAYREVAA